MWSEASIDESGPFEVDPGPGELQKDGRLGQLAGTNVPAAGRPLENVGQAVRWEQIESALGRNTSGRIDAKPSRRRRPRKRRSATMWRIFVTSRTCRNGTLLSRFLLSFVGLLSVLQGL